MLLLCLNRDRDLSHGFPLNSEASMILTSLSHMMCFIKVQTKPRERNIVVLSHSLNKHGFMCDTMCNIYDFPVKHDACHHF